MKLMESAVKKLKMQFMQRLPQIAGLLDRLSPALAGGLAWRLWRSHARLQPRPPEQAVLARAEAGWLLSGDARLRAYRWGDSPRQVLLVHGWGGAAAQMTPMVDGLLDAGFSVLAFDQPGHGAATGDVQHVAEMSEQIDLVLRAAGPFEAVIGHSVGGAAAALAISRLPVDRPKPKSLVMIGSPGALQAMVGRLTGWLGLSEPAVANLRQRMLARAGLDWPAVDAAVINPLLADVRGLLIHDQQDQEVPIGQARYNLRHWPGAELRTTDGLGHRRPLRDATVLAWVQDFVAGRLPALDLAS